MTRGMLRISVCAALVLGLLPALSACSKSRSPSVGGETNWLLQCSADEPCETGSCLCGVCTLACDDDERCDGDFEGACTETDDGAGALLCGSSASRSAPAVCLPRCSSDDACGEGYMCEQAVCVPAVPVSGGPPDGGGSGGSGGSGGLDGRISNVIGAPFPDGGPPEGGPCNPFFPDASDCGLPTAMDIAPLLDELARSEEAWNGLVAGRDDTYWYQEHNCAVNTVGGGGEVTIVQVERGVPRVLGVYPISTCVATVNRYGALSPTPTMPELYELCTDLVRLRGNAITLRTDDDNVISKCFTPDEPGCFDVCGSGFALAGWGVGSHDQDAGLP